MTRIVTINTESWKQLAYAGLAVFLALVATLCRWLMDGWIGESLPFFTFYFSVLASAWLGGLVPGMAGLVLGALLGNYFFAEPRFTLRIDSIANQFDAIRYILVGLGTVLICEALHQYRRRTEFESELIRVTLASIGDAVITTDVNGRITYLNSIAVDVTGWSVDEALGESLESVFRIINEDTRAPVTNPATRALKEGVVVGLANHTILIARDGSERPIDDSAAPIRDVSGNIIGCVLIFRDVSMRRHAELALKRKEEELRERYEELESVYKTTPVGMAQLDRDLKFVRINDRLAEMNGLPAPAHIGRRIGEVVPDIASKVEAAFRRILETGEPIIDTEIVGETAARPGVRRTWLESWYPQRKANGEIVGVNAAIMEITDRKAVEAALQDSEARYRSLTQAITSIVWTSDKEGQFVTPQSSWASFTGQTWSQMRGFGWLEAVHPEDRERVRKLWEAACASQSLYTSEGRLWHAASQSYRHFEARGVPILNADGSVRECVGKILDVEDRYQAIEKLKESEARYRAIGEAIDFGIWMSDAAGQCTYASESFLKLIGMSQEECSKLGWTAALHPDDVDETVAAWLECVRTGCVWDREHRVKGVDGEWYCILARGVPVRDSESKIVAWVGMNLDISRLKQAQEALSEADRRKDEFLAVLAHELRNPLAPIRNAVQVLHMKGPALPEIEWARDVIDRQMQSMTRLIDDLMDVSRISRGKIELKKEPVELANVIQGAVESSRPLIEQQEHTLSVTLPSEPIILNADLTRLAQVFLNLLNNAAKYTERGGRIDLFAERQGSDVVVSVQDTGIGIPTSKLSSVFDLFSQIESSLSRTQGGLGIGLSLVKRLVEMHAGSIEAHSEGIGKGSAFTVRLPISVNHTADQAHQHDGRSTIPTSQLKILVVDDNRDAASSLSMLLKLMGNEVHVAHDGQEALLMADDFRPHVVVLDIGLPKMNGYDACRAIRHQPWGKKMILIAVTGWGQDSDKQRSEDAGFDRHLVKPIDPTELMKLLSQLDGVREKRDA